MRVGAEVRFFNFKLRQRRFELGLTQARIAEYAGVEAQFISTVETLKLPVGKIGTVRDKLNRVAQALGMDFEDLFDQEYLDAIQGKLLPRRRKPLVWVREVSLYALSSSMQELIALPPPDEVLNLDGIDLKQDINEALSSLTEREASVIKMRFGIDADRVLTFAEIAELEGVSLERVRQIEAKALRRLRHPIRAYKLRPHTRYFVSRDLVDN